LLFNKNGAYPVIEKFVNAVISIFLSLFQKFRQWRKEHALLILQCQYLPTEKMEFSVALEELVYVIAERFAK
jgi:threonine aldolase